MTATLRCRIRSYLCLVLTASFALAPVAQAAQSNELLIGKLQAIEGQLSLVENELRHAQSMSNLPAANSSNPADQAQILGRRFPLWGGSAGAGLGCGSGAILGGRGGGGWSGAGLGCFLGSIVGAVAGGIGGLIARSSIGYSDALESSYDSWSERASKLREIRGTLLQERAEVVSELAKRRVLITVQPESPGARGAKPDPTPLTLPAPGQQQKLLANTPW